MGNIMDRRREIIASQPHLVTASGSAVLANIAEPKIEHLKVSFTPIQTGSGTPSPSNVRRIMGSSRIMASIGTMPVDISLGGTYYGGTVDLVSGTMTVTYAKLTVSSSTTINAAGASRPDFLTVTVDDLMLVTQARPHPTGYCDIIETVTQRTRDRITCVFGTYEGRPYNDRIYVYDLNKTYTDITTGQGAVDKLVELAPTFVYELNTPFTVNLTPQTISALRGQQTVTSPAGAVEISYWTN